MDEKEALIYDIKNLKEASTYISQALIKLVDVEEFTEEQYKTLDYLKQDIDDLIIENELKLEKMEE